MLSQYRLTQDKARESDDVVKVVLMSCDKCGSTSEVLTYRTGLASDTPYEVDLCEKCAEPMRELMDIGQKRVAGWGVAPQGGSAQREPELRTKVYDPEELDAMEKAYREKHKKS